MPSNGQSGPLPLVPSAIERPSMTSPPPMIVTVRDGVSVGPGVGESPGLGTGEGSRRNRSLRAAGAAGEHRDKGERSR